MIIHSKPQSILAEYYEGEFHVIHNSSGNSIEFIDWNLIDCDYDYAYNIVYGSTLNSFPWSVVSPILESIYEVWPGLQGGTD